MCRIFTFLICLLCFIQINSQTELKWEKDYIPGSKSVRSCLMVENADQQIVLLSLAQNQKLFFTLLDRTGAIQQEATFEIGKGNIHAALATETDYLIAGDIQKNGKTYPALWRINRAGTALQLLSLPTDQSEGSFHDLSQNLKRHIFLTGQIKGQLCLLQLDEKLVPLDSPYLATYPESSAGTALAINPFGDIFITGHILEKKQPHLWVWKFEANRSFVWENRYGDSNTKGVDALIMDNGDVMISGVQESAPFNADIYLLRLAPNGRKIWARQYSSAGNESGSTILQTPNRNLLLAGAITSFGARTSDIWLKWLDKESGDTLQTLRKGNHFTDRTEQVLRLQNGDYVVAAIAEQKVQLLYYQSGENLCESKLLDSREAIRFKPILDNELALGDEKYTFRGTLLSNTLLDESNILIKRKLLAAKSAEELSLGTIRLETRPTHPGQYCYYLEKTLWLESGNNGIYTTVQKDKVLLKDSLSIYNLPKRANLHLLSIGIAYGDLNFTDEDASDFATIFQEQEGRLYEKIYTTRLNSKEETLAYKIVDKIVALADNKDSTALIQPEDVLMVFISSHGEMSKDNNFILPGSDYRPDNERTCIQFQKEVLDRLEKMDCKKLLFIDACKSGSAKGEQSLSDALAGGILQVVSAAPGVTTISSSADNQLSYEQNDLQNGIFTAALKEALTQRVSEVDANSDRIISVGELYQFLQMRVPELVATYYPTRQQTPVMPRNDLKDSFPIFYINY